MQLDLNVCLYICCITKSLISQTLTLWTGPFPIEGMSAWFILLLCFVAIPVFNTNSVDHDQRLCFAVSDLGLHCLPMSLLCHSRHKC